MAKLAVNFTSNLPFNLALRPFRAAGLKYLLLDNEKIENIFENKGEKKTPKLTGSVADTEQMRVSKNSQVSADFSNQNNRLGQDKKSSELIVEKKENNIVIPKQFLPVEKWNEKWQILLNRKPPLPQKPRIVWTYDMLAYDLLEQGEDTKKEKRRNFLRRLISLLNMPAGTHAFFPYKFTENDENMILQFMSALNHFKPDCVVLVGTKPMQELSPIGNLPIIARTSTVSNGYMFFSLPEIEELQALSDAEFARIISFIKLSLK